jgi:tetratricopeptide (TPR) repeat protein
VSESKDQAPAEQSTPSNVVPDNSKAELQQLCLMVDCSDASDLTATWATASAGLELPLPVELVPASEAKSAIQSGKVVSLILAASAASETTFEILKAYRNHVGAIGTFQAVICDDPSPEFSATLFEYAIEYFISPNNLAGDVVAFLQTVADLLKDTTSSEYKSIQLTRSIRSGDQIKIEQLKNVLKQEAGYDHLSAYSFGKSLEASGEYNEAIEAFQKSSSMNKMFHASTSSLGENLIITGRLDEAQAVFERLEKTNSKNSDRKLQLATIYTEKGDFEKAKAYMKEAAALTPNNPKLSETKAHMYLKAGKVQEAFQLMDKMSEVGPFFAARLNEMGIKLSQAGKGKSAIALYQKAHKVVRPELRYKISMNAALAYYRLGELDLALKHLDRCEQEFGKSYEKLEKIRKAIVAAKKKGPASPATNKTSAA